jgi:4-alpha-glucanotransferase
VSEHPHEPEADSGLEAEPRFGPRAGPRSGRAFCAERHAGLLLPLFSCPSTRSWGIGEIPDIVPLSRWLAAAGLDFLQMLPINEMASGQHSPYSSLSAMAIDPLYIGLGEVAEFAELGGEDAIDPSERDELASARRAKHVEYTIIQRLKQRALARAFERFDTEHWSRQTARAAKLKAFVEREAWWLDDYTLFRVLHDRFERRAWWEWPHDLAAREPAALDEVRRTLARERRYFAYVQWLAHKQWTEARRNAHVVWLFGDLPFMVAADSADVWSHQHLFSRDLSVGTPPDAFSETGQDWGLPAYRWKELVREELAWLRRRAQRGAELFDGFRVDHVIGFFRTWVRPPAGESFFTPPDESDQRELGERILRVFLDSGACIVAEDLGTVPPFLRESMLRLDVPGYRVLRWEREWDFEGQPFRDPRQYPPLSVATTGTHDTDTMADWWDGASLDERQALVALEPLSQAGVVADQPFGSRVRDALLELMFQAGSNLLVLPLQDVFGWRDRINTPATIGSDNWSWRIPWPVNTMRRHAEVRERGAQLRAWAQESGRISGQR